ncbi:alpha/beta hydrolase fold domain-containing protein [Aureibaculum sp. A20]|uniref:Alpha/beta hydrolase fold domain-containing protein n=1 Tax=Aureibaculum flavum TaxID=2795986 RepID=A0ABS0WV84_9FLAO|nr:sialate O-acetylesterase [Aureibaculum flavum]MBJ2175907.1 alpha/beta hydrolase fold domain-containing protein [Aureibaculum flavum]
MTNIKNKFKIFTFFYLFSLVTIGQIKDTIYLWSDKVPNETENKHAAIQTKNVSGNVKRLTDITNPSLTVFKPENPNASKAAIIVCPGGGYQILAIDKEGYEIAQWLNELGYTAFVLEYRVPKKEKGALQDVQRAIRLVRSKSVEFNLDPQKIGIMGFSAGGHLSANAAINYHKKSYSSIDVIDDISSRPNFAMLIYPAYLDKGDNRNLSPELKIDKNTPPFFIFGTSDDSYGNSSLVMATALRDKKVPIELHMLAKGGHGYGLRAGNIAAETWPTLAAKWMENWLDSREIAKYQRELNFPKKEEPLLNSPKKENVWVFLMAGQSNMAGRAFVEPSDTISSPRILTINKNKEIIQAKEPLNIYEPNMEGLDCGMSFARNLLKNAPENTSILLIPTAVGGSSISQWIGDSIHRNVKLLSNFKEKVTLAKKYGIVKGILWHQGESDANKNGILNYDKNLKILFKKFRRSTGNRKLPILVGELGGYRKNSDSWKSINQIINNHAKKDKFLYVISTSDFNHKGDNLHFDSQSQRLFGKRLAKTFTQKNKNSN